MDIGWLALQVLMEIMLAISTAVYFPPFVMTHGGQVRKALELLILYYIVFECMLGLVTGNWEFVFYFALVMEFWWVLFMFLGLRMEDAGQEGEDDRTEEHRFQSSM